MHQYLLFSPEVAAARAAVPGVVSVAQVSQVPLSRSGSNSGFAASRKQENSSAKIGRAHV